MMPFLIPISFAPRYDTDKNGYVDHEEFLHRLGIEIAPGDVNGISNKITKGSEDEIHRHNHNQKVLYGNISRNFVWNCNW